MQNLENEQTLCNTALNKLEALCRENHLTYLFQSDAYPISLTLRPDTSLDGQMSLLEEDRRPPHKNTYIRYTFKGEKDPDVRFEGSMDLSSKTLATAKTLACNLHYAFLQFYWASVKHGFAPPTNMPRLTD